MNCLQIEARTSVIAALVEGTSINATCRMTGVAKHTVLKLLKDIGCACAAYHNVHVGNLLVRRIQADEIWAFAYGKDKNLTLEQMQAGAGSVWTWTALDADTKLIVSYMLGDRGAATAQSFMRDVAGRIAQPHSTHYRWSPRLCRGRRRCLRGGHRLCHASQDLRGLE